MGKCCHKCLHLSCPNIQTDRPSPSHCPGLPICHGYTAWLAFLTKFGNWDILSNTQITSLPPQGSSLCPLFSLLLYFPFPLLCTPPASQKFKTLVNKLAPHFRNTFLLPYTSQPLNPLINSDEVPSANPKPLQPEAPGAPINTRTVMVSPCGHHSNPESTGLSSHGMTSTPRPTV